MALALESLKWTSSPSLCDVTKGNYASEAGDGHTNGEKACMDKGACLQAISPHFLFCFGLFEKSNIMQLSSSSH